MKTELLFVYGTLMKKHIKATELVGQSDLKFLCNGRIEGTLYDLGDYPGVIKDKGKSVYGELYEISNSNMVLQKLDEYEEFDPKNPEGSLFVRKKTKVLLDDGRQTIATVYYYNGKIEGLKIIPNGKWSET